MIALDENLVGEWSGLNAEIERVYATLLRFVFWGSFQFVLPVRSPVNAESVIAVSFLLLLTSPVAGANWSERKG